MMTSHTCLHKQNLCNRYYLSMVQLASKPGAHWALLTCMILRLNVSVMSRVTVMYHLDKQVVTAQIATR
jgi:hypothetical protein